MKKEYGKPLVYIEDFTITQNIATCTSNVGANHYDGQCTFTVEDPDEGTLIFYYQSMSGKCIEFVDGGGNDFIGCYYGPIGGASFAS